MDSTYIRCLEESVEKKTHYRSIDPRGKKQ
jgi:hypothetical protein